MKDSTCIMSTTSCIMSDNNILYIVGVFLLISIVLIFFINFKSKDTNVNENVNKDSDYECDGDKCFIKHKQTNKSM